MKKLGYTLSEALIALTIVGVLSAIIIPSLNRFKPNERKATFLKTYDSIQQIVNRAVNSHTLYPSICMINGERKSCLTAPLYNNSEISVNGVPRYGTVNNDKLCQVLADGFGVYDDPRTDCSTNTVLNNVNLESVNFVTKEGIAFSMYTETNPDYVTKIVFDVNDEEEPNSFGGKNIKINPDKFRILLAADGTIVPSDSISQAHLLTRTELKNRLYGLNNSNVPAEVNDLRADLKSIKPSSL